MVKKLLRTYMPFLRSGMQAAMMYRLNFMGFFIGNLFSSFVMYFIWKAVFLSQKGSTFLGFSMPEMVVYIFITSLTGYLAHSGAARDVGTEIKDGTFSMRLIKPVNYGLSCMFNELGGTIVLTSILAVPMLLGVEIYRAVSAGHVMFNVPYFLLYCVSVSMSYLLSFYFNLCFGFLTFFLKNLWGLSMVKDVIVGFLSGALIPIAFMPSAMQTVLSILPFSSMSYTPVMIYMGKYTPLHILLTMALQAVWVVAFWLFSKLIWNGATKFVTVQGG